VTIAGTCLVRRIFSSKTQVPDSFPFVLEREFGHEAAQNYESFVQQQQLNQLTPLSMQIEPLPSNLNFANGVDYMNQVISYDRLIFFGHLQESQGLLSAEELDPALKGQKLYGKPNVCFGERV